MASFEKVFENPGPGFLVGIGVALAAPIILPAVGTIIRPMAKAIIKGGLIAGDKIKEMTAEVREQMNDLVAEAKMERTTSSASGETVSTPSTAPIEQPTQC